ncbi:MAG: bifunctional glutamate N-acetyltransferase/amino-acid acetyltransferase ArgJ [Candidatus Omnitrophica bacterium]|nr:bifunctional glutamate N-acetyltransferase/amino-acid acetyltransferase ArgJ [Candidatus Omnitrophota bacterium]
MKIYKKAILPCGFKASGVSCGIKKPGKLDLALLYSCFPAKAAGLFTVNKIPAAPVILCRDFLGKGGLFRAIIANSGNANCFNGKKGLADSLNTAGILAKGLGVKRESVLVASTGIIGRRLPLAKIKYALPGLVKKLSYKGIKEASEAIMTTDTFSKGVTVKVNIAGRPVTLCGIAKGAGMISPDMATLLVFMLTDFDLSPALLKKALKEAVDNSFNCITVDGCMSTNDSVILLANGAALDKRPPGKEGLKLFTKALSLVSLELAKMIVRDAEGATKFIEIKVTGAKDFNQARRAALSIANSSLFKTAVYGENPNFGRIASALGASGVSALEKNLKIKVSSLKKKDITVNVALGVGKANAVVYTSDLTPEYIKINAEYN